MKYMVMECHLSYAVVLDEEGRFLKVANQHYKEGQMVAEVIEMQPSSSTPQKKKASKWLYSLAAMAACLVLAVASVFQIQIGQMTYASVYMTINPEVRIDVNRNDVVVRLDGVNTDGEELIEEYDYKKKELGLVLDQLVDKAIDMGYLHEGGKISLVLDADNDEWVVSHGDALTAHLNEYLSEKLSVTIEATDKKIQSSQIIIPVTPGNIDYGESDYGEDRSATPPPVSSEPAGISYHDRNYDDGQTDYGGQDHPGGSSYDDGQTDYGEQDRFGGGSYDDGQADDGGQDHSGDDRPADHTESDDNGQSDYGPDDDADDNSPSKDDDSDDDDLDDAQSDDVSDDD